MYESEAKKIIKELNFHIKKLEQIQTVEHHWERDRILKEIGYNLDEWRRLNLLDGEKYGLKYTVESLTQLYKKYNLYHHKWNNEK